MCSQKSQPLQPLFASSSVTNTVTSQFVLVSVNPFKFTKSVSEKSHHFASEVTALSLRPHPSLSFQFRDILGFLPSFNRNSEMVNKHQNWQLTFPICLSVLLSSQILLKIKLILAFLNHLLLFIYICFKEDNIAITSEMFLGAQLI